MKVRIACGSGATAHLALVNIPAQQAHMLVTHIVLQQDVAHLQTQLADMTTAFATHIT